MNGNFSNISSVNIKSLLKYSTLSIYPVGSSNAWLVDSFFFFFYWHFKIHLSELIFFLVKVWHILVLKHVSNFNAIYISLSIYLTLFLKVHCTWSWYGWSSISICTCGIHSSPGPLIPCTFESPSSICHLLLCTLSWWYPDRRSIFENTFTPFIWSNKLRILGNDFLCLWWLDLALDNLYIAM
jgi:hypothetical protein